MLNLFVTSFPERCDDAFDSFSFPDCRRRDPILRSLVERNALLRFFPPTKMIAGNLLLFLFFFWGGGGLVGGRGGFFFGGGGRYPFVLSFFFSAAIEISTIFS